jgi:hypothetical protein
MQNDTNLIYGQAADYLAEQGRRIFTGHMNGGLWNARCLDAYLLSMNFFWAGAISISSFSPKTTSDYGKRLKTMPMNYCRRLETLANPTLLHSTLYDNH